MKISDQGFTERLSSQPSRTNATSDATGGSASKLGKSTSLDNLQLSSLSARLQDTSSLDASRAARVSQIAKAVNTGGFRIDPAQISGSLVSEAVQFAGR